MRSLKALSAILGVVIFNTATAQVDFTGTWQGDLELSPDTELTVQFIISHETPAGYSALLNTPDSTVKNLPASAIDVQRNQLSLEFDELSGTFLGRIEEGVLVGNWDQPGQTYPLSMQRYEPSELSEADIRILIGRWLGTITVPEEYEVELAFAVDDEGEFGGSVIISGETDAIRDIRIVNDHLVFEAHDFDVRFEAQVTDSQITGAAFNSTSGARYSFNVSKNEPISD